MKVVLIMSKYKIAFFDIDGTLASNTPKDPNLSISDRIPLSAKKALISLEQNGITPLIATGRGKSMILELVNDLQISSYISANGQSVVFHGEEIYSQFLDKATIKEIIDELDKHDLTYSFDTPDKRIVTAKSPELIVEMEQGDDVGDHDDYLLYDVYQLAIYHDDIRSLIPKLNLPTNVSPKVVAPMVANIVPLGVSKAIAIEKVLELLNIEKSAALAFGDEENDLEMFDAVGTSIALGNAIELLKAKATYITDTVDNDGIHKACKHFELY